MPIFGVKTDLFEGLTWISIFDIVRAQLKTLSTEAELLVLIRTEFEAQEPRDSPDGYYESEKPEHRQQI